MAVKVLNSLILPSSERFTRDMVAPPQFQSDNYRELYDFHTLFYDAILFPSKRRICLICPKLMNLERIIRDGRFTSSEGSHKITRVVKYKRFAEVWLKCSEAPKSLRFSHGDFEREVPLSPEEPGLFAGLNCAVLKSKDNDLIWLRDWADYHVKVHGLQGLVLFDNASQRYTAEDVDRTLRSVPGLSSVCVVEAPHSFGPLSVKNGRSDALFLQVALLNIARLRFLRSANAVLLTDVDELVAPTAEGSIFKTTRRSLLGYTLFYGKWLHAKASESGTVRHADHIYRTADDFCNASKYCICPGGIFGSVHWDVHGAVRGFLKQRFMTDKVHYWHCRNITTNWKYNRNEAMPEPLIRAEAPAEVMAAVFPAVPPEETRAA